MKRQLGKQSRKKLLSTLTNVYRDDAKLYPGIADLLRTLIATRGVCVGLVTRNITNDPELTIRTLLARHDIDSAELDFVVHVPLGHDKTTAFRAIREKHDINPARSFACGDEHQDFASAMAAGMHCFMVSYGFEAYTRLTRKFDVPTDIISRTPKDFCARVLHAFDIEIPSGSPTNWLQELDGETSSASRFTEPMA